MKLSRFFKKRGAAISFLIIAIILGIMPLLLNAGMLSGSSTVIFLGKCMAFAIGAMGIDLIWGYTGILSLGHGLYFALGGYCMAMYLKLQETGGKITDFMHIGGLDELPLIWKPFNSFALTLILIIAVPSVVAFIIAIRDGENRTYFSGYKVSAYKNFIYVLSAALAGIAGAVFVNFNGSITPSQMTISYSITMVIWVAVGGRGTIIGAVIGALLINLCEYNLSTGSMVEIWQYIIGAVFCVTIIFFKSGIVGIVSEQLPALFRKLKAKGKDKAKEAA